MGTVSKIFILHGWIHAKGSENPLAKWDDFLSELKKNNFEAELLRVPGLTEDVDKVYKLEDYILWLEKVLKNESNVTLIGHSNGGRIAAAFTAKYPEKIANLILVDSAGIFRNKLSGIIKRGIFKALAKVGKKISSSDKLKKILYKLAREGDYSKANSAQRQTMQNLIYLNLAETFQKITTKTIVIWGKNDKVTPLEDGKLIHNLIKNSKLFIINEAKHSPQFTNLKEVVDIIRKEV